MADCTRIPFLYRVPPDWAQPCDAKQCAPQLTAGTVRVLPSKEAFLTIVPRAVHCTDDEFAELWEMGMDPDRVPRTKFMGNDIKRIQGTFGADYKFGSQKTQNLGPVPQAPAAVRRCWTYALRTARDTFNIANPAAIFTGAHCNWYNGGEAWLDMHRDEEVDEQQGVPIFSFTLLRAATDAPKGTADYRCFAVDHQEGQATRGGSGSAKVPPTFSVPMRDGTLIVMSGRDFQSSFVHGVPKTTAKKFAGVWRINVTIRAWSGAAAVRDGGTDNGKKNKNKKSATS